MKEMECEERKPACTSVFLLRPPENHDKFPERSKNILQLLNSILIVMIKPLIEWKIYTAYLGMFSLQSLREYGRQKTKEDIL
jgi:hypothetical protein